MKTFPIHKQYIQGPDFIELTAEHLHEQLAFAKANNVDGFAVGSGKDVFPDLQFLPDDTRGLGITFESVKDISAIHSFKKLEVLRSHSYPNSVIDLAYFPDMRDLSIYWNKHLKSLDKIANVMRLYLWGYKPKSRNMETFQNWNKLVYATFVQLGVDNLDGIENLARIKELSLWNMRPLKRFFSDERKATFPLEELDFSIAGNFDIDTIPDIPSLKFLGLNNVGKKETLKHLLPRLPNLERLAFTQSELSDGNLDYLLVHPTLKNATIDNKKHYSMKEKEIQKLLDEKNKRALL